MAGPDIFISYSREDRTAARHFAHCFAEEGFTVWWDAALHSGETFDEVIEAALKAAAAVVVLWSPRSVTSRWVRAEATLADRRNKLAPVIIEPCDRPIIFELTHTTDLSQWDGETTDSVWRSFVHDLHRLLDKGKAGSGGAPSWARPVPAPEPTRQPGADRFAPRPGAPPPEFARPGAPDKPRFSPPAHEQVRSRPTPQPVVPAPPPPLPEEEEEEDPTQFYTGTDGFHLFRADEYHCLEVNDGDKLAARYVVSPLGIKIGRTAPADVILADSRVSRAHCTVELAGKQLKVSDLKSTNGTFVDGERIVEPTLLEVGSVLRVGNVSFVHEIRTAADV
jgi:hypothetical protein